MGNTVTWKTMGGFCLKIGHSEEMIKERKKNDIFFTFLQFLWGRNRIGIFFFGLGPFCGCQSESCRGATEELRCSQDRSVTRAVEQICCWAWHRLTRVTAC